MDEHHSNPLLLPLSIWLFYAAFAILGVGVGLIIGVFVTGDVLLSAVLGFLVGIGLGILTNAILVAIKAFKRT